MESNSIRNNMSKEDIISDINLSLNADILKENVAIVVEGEDDINFLKEYFTENVFIYESYDGKNGVDEIVNNFFEKNERVIGIMDRDYSIELSEKIIYYDYNSLEMMLISNDYTFKKVHDQFYLGRLSPSDVRKYIMKNLLILSLIRQYNEIYKKGINFNGFQFDIIFSTEEYVTNYNDIIATLKLCNSEGIRDILYSSELKEYIENNVCYEYEYLYNLTRGHDFIMLFNLYCKISKRRKSKRRDVKNDVIEYCLRCSYNKEALVSTEFYVNLLEKESSINVIIFNFDHELYCITE